MAVAPTSEKWVSEPPDRWKAPGKLADAEHLSAPAASLLASTLTAFPNPLITTHQWNGDSPRNRQVPPVFCTVAVALIPSDGPPITVRSVVSPARSNEVSPSLTSAHHPLSMFPCTSTTTLSVRLT